MSPCGSSPKPERRHAALLVLGTTLFALVALMVPARAAEGGGPSEVTFIIQVLILVAAGRVCGEIAQRLGQPAVMGQLIAGLILGPSVFGLLAPDWQKALFPTAPEQKAMLDAVSQLGILMLLLLTGMETDPSLIRRVGRAAASVSLTGIAIPFACGVAAGEMLPDAMLPHPEMRLVTSLFLGTALSISSVKIVAMVVREMNFLSRDIGQIIVTSAIIDDTLGWVVIAITFSLARHGTVDAWALGQAIVGTFVFLALSFTVGRVLVFRAIRWSNDHLEGEFPVISTILVIMAVMALATHLIGVHSVLGAFVAGVLVGQSPILARHVEEQLRGLIVALFMPVFFGLAGLGADLTILQSPYLLGLTAALVLIASIGKFGGAFLGGALGGLDRRESLALAFGMNARGSTEVIVATIGLQMGALSHDLFTMIVAMAVLTTMVMPPTLRWALARIPLSEDEERRIAREAFAATGFVPNLERLLVTVDGSANGKLASRLAGLVSAFRGMPVTVLDLRPASPAAEPAEARTRPAEAEIVETSAEGAVRGSGGGEEEARTPRPKADLIVTKPAEPDDTEAAVSTEARKGYDLLFVGLHPLVAPEGGFGGPVTRAALGFDGPFAIAAARGIHAERPAEGPLDILVPVSGSEVSRRGAEAAMAIARASGAPVTVLLVSHVGTESRGTARFWRLRRQDEAVLKAIVELADRYGVAVRTTVRVRRAPEDAIRRQAAVGRHNLIVLGVNRRPGERLAFGKVAEALLDEAETSLLFVST